jgi:glucose-6-phosphate isomerase
MLAINNCISQSTQKTPYEMVFGQPARNDHDFWIELHKQSTNNSIVNEEDIPQSISDDFNMVDESVCRIFNYFPYFSFFS